MSVTPRSRRDRLFGAACLRLKLEERGQHAAENEIYKGTLDDLALSDAEVLEFLVAHRDEVSAALARGRPNSEKQ